MECSLLVALDDRPTFSAKEDGQRWGEYIEYVVAVVRKRSRLLLQGDNLQK